MASEIRAVCIALTLVCGGSAGALETDQYWAWSRPLKDSGPALNAKFDTELDSVLAEVNRKGANRFTCDDVAGRLVQRFRLFLMHPLEVWATNSPLVDRAPASGEEDAYARTHLYHDTGFWDPALWLPPSPTIEVAGVRFGTDKLSHFVSEGWMYYRWYRAARESGRSIEDAEYDAIGRGIHWEMSILGMTSSGILSPADLEANDGGLRYFRDLCEGETPALSRSDGKWIATRPTAFERYVSPAWDESWNPPVYRAFRWERVLPILTRYCGDLDDPMVQERRRRYAQRRAVSPTDAVLRGWIEAGRLADPRFFSIDAVCGGAAGERGASVPPKK